MTIRAPWLLLLGGVVALTGCRRPTESKPAHPNPKAALAACRAVLTDKPSKVTAARVRRVVTACGKLLSEPACRKGWLDTYAKETSLKDMLRAQHGCLCGYCKRLQGKRLTFCSRYCGSGRMPSLLPKGTSPVERSELHNEYLRHSRKLWEEIRHYEYGSQCSLHEQSAELLGQMVAEIAPFMFDKILAKRRKRPPPPEPPEPIIPEEPPPAKPPAHLPLDLALVMGEEGIFLKSRYGAECPPGAPVDKKICFSTRGGLTDWMLGKLHRHLWYLFASKYRDPMFYKSPRDRHTLTLIPEPTTKYLDIVRVLDVIREIPRDAKNPPPEHPKPPGGCAQTYDAKTKTWDFAKGSDGRSVREAACMYYRVTLALGSS